MKVFSFAAIDTGLFTGRRYCGIGSSDLAQNTPAGCIAIEGAHDPLRVKLDLSTRHVVPHRPPAPAEDSLRTWLWDEQAWAWIPFATPSAVAAQARARRDAALAGCDWVILRASEQNEPVPAEWLAYRTALRDIPLQPGFPVDIEWPTPPGAVLPTP